VRFRGVTFLLIGVLAPALALAQSPEDALLNDCYTLRRAGRHAASLPRCEEAASRFASGRSLTQLALTEMALERWTAAATHLTAGLADRAHPWVQQNRTSVEDALRTVQTHVGVLEVGTNVTDATVSLRGAHRCPRRARCSPRRVASSSPFTRSMAARSPVKWSSPQAR